VITLAAIEAARSSVERFAVRTPLIRDDHCSALIGADVHLKLESLQPTGSFKVRGAAARIAGIDHVAAPLGVITASTGNHGRAVAYVARELGIPATVCLSEHVPSGKLDALRQLDCILVVGGSSLDEAFERAEAVAAEPGGPTMVHSILDPVVIAGQGSCGLEILEQLPETALVVVPVSGGGLIAGVATALHALRPGIRVVGVSMVGAAVMHASLAAGRPVRLDEVPSLADSLQGGIGLDNDTSFPIVRQLVEEIVLVEEDEIEAAMLHALRDHRLVLEGAGAVGIAGLLSGRISVPSGPVVVVCTGANAEWQTLADLVEKVGVR
jgi:threonine dehydratase